LIDGASLTRSDVRVRAMRREHLERATFKRR
jgi:hypothetical protein